MKDLKYKEMPPIMARRHAVLQRIYNKIRENPEIIKKLFDFNKTEHADLELSWMDENFQKKEIGALGEYQIVIAAVKAGQISDAHLHEIGSSSFIILGKKTGFNEPKNLILRTGLLDFSSLKVRKLDEIKCEEGMEGDIPSNTIHQFQNKGNKEVNLLIVTSPIIDVKKGQEDTHFAL